MDNKLMLPSTDCYKMACQALRPMMRKIHFAWIQNITRDNEGLKLLHKQGAFATYHSVG